MNIFKLQLLWIHCFQSCNIVSIQNLIETKLLAGFYFVGRIFDLPLRSKREELQFCYGTNSSDDENEEIRNGGGNDKQENSNKIKNRVSNKKKVKFDWIPPNVSDTLVRKIRVWFVLFKKSYSNWRGRGMHTN